MSLAERPDPATPVPPLMTSWASAHGFEVAELVWANELGGLTGRLTSRDEVFFAKWSPVDLADEAVRMAWLADRFPAPRVVDLIAEQGEWLLITHGLPGETAVGPLGQADPDRAAFAMGAGLARLHALDPADCPFGAPDWVGPARGGEAAVVVHGDPCAPNTLLDTAGRFLAIVDVGELGVADRWSDLAIGSWSVDWDFGPGHEAAFWAGYGEAPDAEAVAHYRRRWDPPEGW